MSQRGQSVPFLGIRLMVIFEKVYTPRVRKSTIALLGWWLVVFIHHFIIRCQYRIKTLHRHTVALVDSYEGKNNMN